MTQQLLKELEKAFASAANEKIAVKQSDYMRGLFPFFGIQKPKREEIEKKILKKFPIKDEKTLHQLLLKLWKKDKREFHYAALQLAKNHRKLHSPEILPVFETMIRTQSWWDTVDDLAADLVGLLIHDHPELITVMDTWIEDPYLWIRRTAIICQLKWKKNTDQKRLFSYCKARMDEKDFFIRKAIGWALRQYSKTNQDAVRAFVNKHQSSLSGVSLREACKYLN